LLTDFGADFKQPFTCAARARATCIMPFRFVRARKATRIASARIFPLIFLAAVLAVPAVLPSPAAAQNDQGDKAKAPQTEQKPESRKDPQRRDDLTEVSKQLAGPAGNPECVWLGRRVVNLLWRDDLDTAFRHLDLYDRFGCPGGHIQATFRCVVRQGPIDPKAQEILSGRVHSCWVNPAAPPAPATAATPAPGTSTQ
jgi:hypothetical protein